MPIRGTHTRFLVLALFAMTSFSPATLAQQSTGKMSKRWPSQSQPQQPVAVRICSCLYAGQNIPIGKTICMKFEGQHVLATCDTVVNSPSWSISKEVCASS